MINLMSIAGDYFSTIVCSAIVVAVGYVLLRLFAPKRLQACDILERDKKCLLPAEVQAERSKLRDKYWRIISDSQVDLIDIWKEKAELDAEIEVTLARGMDAMKKLDEMNAEDEAYGCK